ncbi:MAG: HAMP domain-containing histidine kinase [Bacteroidetes bacterium]|jgi:signal transduction histidine kinase|nr:HAMP domain-containing histidine kinase [Bacteroidota bacterium]MCL5033539.1 HAMP domain-containing histidine kinase [Bacteroidota bacterium]
MASSNPSSVNIKAGLLVFAAVIAAGTLIYTQSIANRLIQRQARIAHLYARSLQYLASDQSTSQDYSFIFDDVLRSIDFPMILTDSHNQPYQPYFRNVRNIDLDTNMTLQQQHAYLMDLIKKMDKQYSPIKVSIGTVVLNYVHYGESDLVTQLRYVPYVEFAVAGLFILISYIAFSYLKRSEQSNIWVGMSRETAHQLGTPLSSLMGWTELLKSDMDNTRKFEILSDVEQDLNRLNKVTMRFSRIGSLPELRKKRIAETVDDVIAYFGKRIPQTGKRVSLALTGDRSLCVRLNPELFEWVLENLVKNSLDAIEDNEGSITIHISKEDQFVNIDVSDTGKGINMKFRRDIFRPGYSTKKRGWGLGLSLAKRIVESYHGGEIFLKDSKTGKGSTFRIRLRAVDCDSKA